ncbi:DNA gyrase inhibitor YacG [Mesorhizobium sp. NBSH29]|uniref:DNA gyrase inhibitor YacG n=1 Tax=Mesorhizobium sp. NBSH29 TaxID=2654249 RepID=UPI00189675C0|nr:DNA gyrase inhibitor YacG [Mesorhizobium sp. NBSH29]QPC86771.1 DNA gyrase inhibitor YacG [Mesorhizobium sp. NBSH29]
MTKTPANVTPLRPKRPCPICGKTSLRELFPFCSTRCKDIDLSKWLTGSYAIPVRDDEDEEGDGTTSRPETEG